MVMVFHEEKEGKDIMHLGKSKSKNSVSLYVLKSTYEYGFHSTKIVEKLGTTEELAKKLNGEDPIEWAKKYIEELIEKKKKRRRKSKPPTPLPEKYPEMKTAHLTEAICSWIQF